MPVVVIVREFTESQAAKITEAVEKSGAKSRQTWAKHILLKAAGVKEALVKKKTADKK